MERSTEVILAPDAPAQVAEPWMFCKSSLFRKLRQHLTNTRVRPTMAAPSSSGLEVLLNTLQNAGDTESMLNILNVLDELLSAGTDRRINYMISKGGSEALLTALVSSARCYTPNYTILLPLLHLLAKVGHRDRQIGLKAQKEDAALVVLSLLRQNTKNAQRAAACLWVLRVFCSSVTTAALLGRNRGLDVVFKLICPHTTKHLRTVKAAVDAFAAMLCSKANCRTAIAKGYIGDLLKLYEDWHNNDANLENIPIRRAIMHCLHHAANSSVGREALVAEGGMHILFQTTQACLTMKGLESLVDPAVQLMRKCYPKVPIPLTSDKSAYIFPLPGRPVDCWDADLESYDGGLEEDSDEDTENEELDNRDYEDDLETDVNKLQPRPEPDRPLEQLSQYVRFCPELHHEFQDLDSSSEVDESADEDSSLEGNFSQKIPRGRRSKASKGESLLPSSPDSPISLELNPGSEEDNHLQTRDFHKHYLNCSRNIQEGHCSMVDRLLEKYGSVIPNHDPRLYNATAANTKSIVGYSILAFPDFWGHLPPQGKEPMAKRPPNAQRKKVLEDIQRLLCPEKIINKVVFDMEDPSPQCSYETYPSSLRFFSKFESGNLQKAIHVRSHEYDLILNADVNCSAHYQWFYFEVSGMVAGVPYRFNIINCEKGNSQYNYGMQPVLYSVREALEGKPHWVRTGSEICYYRNHFCPRRGQSSSFYTLTFTVTFRHDDDVCYLAYHYPYTYTTLQTHLKMLEKSVDPSKVFFRQQNLCDTLAGNSCSLVTITACPSSKAWKHLHQLRNRPCVVLTARVHPGESNSSWVMKGTLEFLCSSDPVAESLREAYIFKIIPMLNPDGVINGNNRCSLNGEDLNRQWLKPDLNFSPTIYHTKGFLYYLNSIGRTPLVFCDYHGHSRKKNVFLYGCSMKETLWQSGSPINTASLKEDPGYRTIAKTLDRIAPAFSFNNCNYLVEKSRASTARVVVWREIGILRSYTMESTYNGCNQGIYKGLQIGTHEMEEMGMKFSQSLLTLRKNSLLYNSRLIHHASALLDLNNQVVDHKSNNCYEDDEPPCTEEIEYSSFSDPFGANDLDMEVNGNIHSAEEEDEGDADICENVRLQTDRKSHLLPHILPQDALETLTIKDGQCNGINVGNSYYC
ncbi:cytosolic carboxypeptidase 4-like isoform X2 [Xyrauchen texanus]|uniref:cytosolic carboxypeptidase 4-like isoform X2 n=1 Tax=Xyrauchen texanus TaxID=154827 RepID=UPI002241EC8A|nr:cytosolic carboxypeptidase 4-like isoform X2 [Xyrauchen texanus]